MQVLEGLVQFDDACLVLNSGSLIHIRLLRQFF